LIQRNWHIVLLALVFLAAVAGLDAVHFWEKVGLEPPHGMAYQGLLFLLFYFVLSNTVFTPYIAIMDERHEQTVGKKMKVEETQRRVDSMLAQYQASLEDARAKAIQERELSGLRADDEAKLHLENTKKKATASLAESKSALEIQVTAARKNIPSESKAVAQDVIGKILTSVPSSSEKRPRAQAL